MNDKKLTNQNNISSSSLHLPAKKLKSYFPRSASGFTLIESLVAISILMIAVASPLTIAQKGLISAIYAKDQVVASFLAQDAIEYIRNKIDENVGGAGWLAGLSSVCGTACYVDSVKNSVTACSGDCPDLQYDEDNNYYNYSTGVDSRFIRSVKIQETVAEVEASITVTMSWKDKGTTRTLPVKTFLYNWKYL